LDEVEKCLRIALSRTAAARSEVSVRLTRAEPGAAHEARIRRALELIASGDIYQVNLARRFELDVKGDAVSLLNALSPAGLTRYEAAFDWPDLCVAAAARRRSRARARASRIRSAIRRSRALWTRTRRSAPSSRW
jgi:anthranilate/para-aminobenzoate synthase component I